MAASEEISDLVEIYTPPHISTSPSIGSLSPGQHSTGPHVIDISDFGVAEHKESDVQEEEYVETLGLCGLDNMGNTCYMNSALQILANTDYFVVNMVSKDVLEIVKDNIVIEDEVSASEVLGGEACDRDIERGLVISDDKIVSSEDKLMDDKIEAEMKNKLSYWMSILMKQMWSANLEIRPKGFKKCLDDIIEKFIGFQQHDSQEFLSMIIDHIGMEACIKKELKPRCILESDEYYKTVLELKNDFKTYDDERDTKLSEKKKIEKELEGETDEEKKILLETNKQSCNSRIDELNDMLSMNIQIQKSLFDDDSKKYINVCSSISWMNALQNKYSFMNNIFTGQTLKTLTCKNCGCITHRFEQFDILSLHLPELTETRTDHKLDDLLNLYTKTEELETKKHCYVCQSPQIFTIKISLYDLPKKLLIMIKKYRQIEDDIIRSGEKVVYEETIKLDDYISPLSKIDGSTNYNLYGGVRHSGRSTEGGHYYAYAKNMISGLWHRFDDDDVYHVPKTEVIDANCYLLAYEL
jgi:ubiquitin C-terminal hydrolase